LLETLEVASTVLGSPTDGLTNHLVVVDVVAIHVSELGLVDVVAIHLVVVDVVDVVVVDVVAIHPVELVLQHVFVVSEKEVQEACVLLRRLVSSLRV
jgi:hypothetical protein